MARDRIFAEVLQELLDAKRSGSFFINVKESSEDLIRLYIKNGELDAITYGFAKGEDVMDIIEYYTLQNATYFNGLAAPSDVLSMKLPMKKFIGAMRKANKTIRVA